jgi:hypothetical protein
MARRILRQGLRLEYLLPLLHPREGFQRFPCGFIKEAGVIPAASPESSLVGSAGPSSPTLFTVVLAAVFTILTITVPISKTTFRIGVLF